MTRRRAAVSVLAGAALVALPAVASGQERAPAADSLRLGELHADALRRDPRAGQLELLEAQTALRLRSLDAERLPTTDLSLQGQYQSDVARIPFELPGGARPALPPNDTYDASLAARQPLLDPTRGPRRQLARARLAESQARVRTTLHALRQRVNDAFFAALRFEAQRAELQAGIADLEARLRTVRERVSAGSALPSEAATLEAELLERGQTLAELESGRDAALVVLGDLTGRTVTSADVLVLPELGTQVAAARERLGGLRARPEFELFARSREVLDGERERLSAQDLPRVSAFGRAGWGRPGLNPLGRELDEYWLAGVQVQWTPWTWGGTRREREELALQERIVATEEAAFAESVRREVVSDLAAMDRLERALATDDEILALRERVLRETRLRLEEGVVTSAEYVDRETDVLAARLARAAHRVELAHAHARFLTLVGLEVR